MNRKQLILLLAFMAVIGAAGLILLNHHQDAWTEAEGKMGEKVLPHFDPTKVAGIRITGAAELHVRVKDKIWRVQERNDYPANFHQISDMLLKLQDLKIVQSEDIGPSQLGRVNLEEPGHGPGSGTLVEFLDAQGKTLDSLLLGKMHTRAASEWSATPMIGNGTDGRYLLVPSDPHNVLLISNTLASFDPNPMVWLSRDFIKMEKIASMRVVSTNGSSWALERPTEAAPWVFAGQRPGEMVNQNKAGTQADKLGSPRFNDVILNMTPSQTGLNHPTLVTVETFDHFTYVIKIGAATADDGRYVTIETTAQASTPVLQDKLKKEQAFASWVYDINAWTFDTLLAPPAQLLQQPEKTAPEQPAARPIAPNVPADLAPLLIPKQ